MKPEQVVLNKTNRTEQLALLTSYALLTPILRQSLMHNVQLTSSSLLPHMLLPSRLAPHRHLPLFS